MTSQATAPLAAVAERATSTNIRAAWFTSASSAPRSKTTTSAERSCCPVEPATAIGTTTSR